ncbi:MAG TPA: long-chain fatty acid--CoA ligase [Polyangiaceae bacterium]|jgi:fatty-acyl-CoA synthase|nr:long-chain fatty acid--CoA ligase [Polyangiaceae bacterium]
MLPGLMMDYPLTMTHFLLRARTFFAAREVVSRPPNGTLHRYAYADYYVRTEKLAKALLRLGVQPGDRVATLAWNGYRHLEAYYAVPGIGAVLHTLNLRLHHDELSYIARHAGDSVILVDRSLLPLLSRFRAELPALKHVVVMPDDGAVDSGDLDYETLLDAESPGFDWPVLDERAGALMCYTSGTTGAPKGVLYSHRSTVLHTMMLCMVDTKGICESDTVMPVVPMFHANAWGMAHAAVGVGAKLVFPGPDLSPLAVVNLMAAERVTFAAAVPTVWLGVLSLLDENPGRWDLSALRMVSVGGAAAPPAMIDGFESRHGIHIRHTWGMTETNPLATVSRLRHDLPASGPEAIARRATQGFAVPFVEQRHVDDTGTVLPWDGTQMGELQVRGPWVASSYYESPEGADKFTEDGWFRTGDVVTIDPHGYVSITDRAKDVIKSGGEWISTQALENALMAHPSVLEAAVFAAEHEKWGERPVAAVVLKEGKAATKAELAAHLEGRFAKWWLPDDYLFIEQIPRTSTGKFKKLDLRARYGKHLLAPTPA